MEQSGNEKLYNVAKRRAAFKRNLFGFTVVNVFLWLIWLINAGADYFKDLRGIPWPAWITTGWSLGIAFHYFNVYYNSKTDMAKAEYEKLKQKS